MTRKPELRAVNCTSCGAGLDILGGGRVKVHVCPYCGAGLDVGDDYAVLYKHTGTPPPQSPIGIGMVGRIDDVEFTVIGTIGREERYGGKVWQWVEHQIFSPTHGYGWLSVEDGHLVFSRRVRDYTGGWITPQSVETAENKPVREYDGENFVYYETSTHTITYVAGEFTWAPEVGETTQTVSMLSGKGMLDFSTTDSEREVILTRYLPQDETARSFGLEQPPEPIGVHPTQPYQPGRHDRFLAMASILFAMAALVVGVVFLALPGTTVLPKRELPVRAFPAEFTFDVTNTTGLVSVDLSADAQNSWAWLDVSVDGPAGNTLFESGRGIEYYSGREGGERWTEGSRSASLRFRPTEQGTYTVYVDIDDTGVWSAWNSDRPRKIKKIGVAVRQGLASAWLPFLAALPFVALAAVMIGRPLFHRRRRFSGSDWTDD